jgi:hypothetical protein
MATFDFTTTEQLGGDHQKVGDLGDLTPVGRRKETSGELGGHRKTSPNVSRPHFGSAYRASVDSFAAFTNLFSASS